MVGFTKEAIDLTEERWEAVQDYNACLERLLIRRKNEIAIQDAFVESKTGWKCAILQQALLYRVCALADGAANQWNSANIIASVTLSRSLLETIVVASHIRDELLRLQEPMNQDAANAIDDLCNKHLFATRNQDTVDAGYGHLATNIITYVNKFDKKFRRPGKLMIFSQSSLIRTAVLISSRMGKSIAKLATLHSTNRLREFAAFKGM